MKSNKSKQEWESIRKMYWIVIIITGLCLLFLSVTMVLKMNEVKAHIDGVQIQLKENTELTDDLIKSYGRFVELSYNTFDSVSTVVENHEIRLSSLENKSMS